MKGMEGMKGAMAITHLMDLRNLILQPLLQCIIRRSIQGK
jgi:hypothetical protein